MMMMMMISVLVCYHRVSSESGNWSESRPLTCQPCLCQATFNIEHNVSDTFINTTVSSCHFVPVSYQWLFKVALMAFDCVRGQSPGYFDDVLVPVHTVGARARLRSADHGDMVVPFSCRVYFGQRNFRSSAPSVWNDLPSEEQQH